MDKKFHIQKLTTILCFMLLSVTAWASDLVYVGTYTNDRDGKDYDIILEYDELKFINLEINVRGSEDSQFCAWEIKGDKKIRAFYSCMEELYTSYKSIDDVYKNNSAKNAQYEINIYWPSFNLQGRHFGESSGYEMENLIDKASVQSYYIVKDGTRQAMVLAVLIDDYGDTPLKSALNFTSPESLQAFMKLVDPIFLSERMQLKEKLMNEKR